MWHWSTSSIQSWLLLFEAISSKSRLAFGCTFDSISRCRVSKEDAGHIVHIVYLRRMSVQYVFNNCSSIRLQRKPEKLNFGVEEMKKSFPFKANLSFTISSFRNFDRRVDRVMAWYEDLHTMIGDSSQGHEFTNNLGPQLPEGSFHDLSNAVHWFVKSEWLDLFQHRCGYLSGTISTMELNSLFRRVGQWSPMWPTNYNSSSCESTHAILAKKKSHGF